MKPINQKIESACAKKDIRTGLNSPILDVPRGKLYASDGHILAAIDVSSALADDDSSGPVPIGALQRARKCPDPINPNALLLNSVCKLWDGSTLPRPSEADVPTDSLRAHIASKLSDTDDRENQAPGIAIDAALLLRLAEALSTDKSRRVKLWFGRNADGTIDPEAEIRVRSYTVIDDTVGLLMPLRLRE